MNAHMKVKLLAQVADGEPIEIGVMEIPLQVVTMDVAGPYAQVHVMGSADPEAIANTLATALCRCRCK